MLKKDDHFLLGSLFKTTGVKGEIVARFTNVVPAKMNKMESVFIEIDGKLVPFFIEYFKEKSSNTALIKFEGINSESQAQEYLGAAIYLPAENKKLLDKELDDFIDVVGYVVKDQNYEVVGKVLEFIENSSNPLLLVETPKNEILIPAHDDLIIEVDDDEKYIVIELADGIMDLDE
jgi:16S rRNA processing protein RimM